MVFQSEDCEETLIWACIRNSEEALKLRVTAVFVAKVDYMSRFAGTSLEVPYLEIFTLVYREEFAYPAGETCLIMTIGFVSLLLDLFSYISHIIKI